MSEKKITLNHITKVEGHAEVDIAIEDGKVKHAHVHSYEGARYFEGLIKGRKWDEVTLITSRICGICSCGHTVASIKAIEHACNITPSHQTLLLRELLTIGERIRSHASHIYFFCLPDYLGFESAIAMAKDYNQEVKDCLEIVRVGNELVKLIGGRDMHPFVPVPGGLTKVESPERFAEVLAELKAILPLVNKTIDLFASLKVPDYERKETMYLALDNHHSFPLHTGELVTNTGLRFKPEQYKEFLEEHFHKGSTAKFAAIQGKEYSTGALARVNIASDKLSPSVQEKIKEHKLEFPTTNLFMQNVAQALEILQWLERAITIIENNTFADEEQHKVNLEKGKEHRGVGVIEVPRGILFHDYTFNDEGFLVEANIITPTVQNLAEVEKDITTYLNTVLEQEPEKNKDELVLEVEKLIRAFDPCFSCSTHFLKVNWKEK
ncbi:Ni/Fe hydrogenase subunit alpha [Candidatus Woesearchaeota archaeon]|nr:Ni/Fe hydrogenase subunit alpha [Nanoarchaeota archaeon]MCB9370780.1 Ni/Fe hydrogenase subunit alpha [Candidatus Woesearchaeota archaeon]USN43881.1 MAG: Ni/Fe hydrogenase subunit alpha [Candidatus Woesearchaeota archaeon]